VGIRRVEEKHMPKPKAVDGKRLLDFDGSTIRMTVHLANILQNAQITTRAELHKAIEDGWFKPHSPNERYRLPDNQQCRGLGVKTLREAEELLGIPEKTPTQVEAVDIDEYAPSAGAKHRYLDLEFNGITTTGKAKFCIYDDGEPNSHDTHVGIKRRPERRVHILVTKEVLNHLHNIYWIDDGQTHNFRDTEGRIWEWDDHENVLSVKIKDEWFLLYLNDGGGEDSPIIAAHLAMFAVEYKLLSELCGCTYFECRGLWLEFTKTSITVKLRSGAIATIQR
jgi:hypothetical protein